MRTTVCFKDLFHPITGLSSFNTSIDQIFSDGQQIVLKQMKYALTYDDPSIFNYPICQLTVMFQFLWYEHTSYIQTCYNQSAYNLCIFYIDKISNEIPSFLYSDTEKLSKILLKCMYSDHENIANKIINDLYQRDRKQSFFIFYTMWESCIDLRYYTIKHVDQKILHMITLDSSDYVYNTESKLRNPLYFLEDKL